MRILHRFAWRPKERELEELSSLGFRPETGAAADAVAILTVDESDPRFVSVRRCLPDDVFVTTSTAFSASERENARFLRIVATGQVGYPQPEDKDFGRALTYDGTLLCTQCGTGAVQIAPFRFTKDPRLKQNRLLQLNWNFETFFTTPETWETVFRPFGITRYGVVQHQSGSVLANVVQLHLRFAPSVRLKLPADLSRQTCPGCEREKFGVLERGIMQLYESPPSNVHMFTSSEVFGYGASASRAVFVSQALYQEIQRVGIRGCRFDPVSEPASTLPLSR